MAEGSPDIALRDGWKKELLSISHRDLFPHPQERDVRYHLVLERLFIFLDAQSTIKRSSCVKDYDSYNKRNEALKAFFRDHPDLQFLLRLHHKVQQRVERFNEEFAQICGWMKKILNGVGISNDHQKLKEILFLLYEGLVQDIYKRNKEFEGRIQRAKNSIHGLIMEAGKGSLTLAFHDIRTWLDLLKSVVESILRNIEVVDERSLNVEERVKKLAMDTCEAIQKIFTLNGSEKNGL